MAIDGWQKMELGTFVTLQRGHDLPEPERKAGDVPIMGSFGITGYHDVAKTKGPGVTVGRSGASFGVVNYSPIDYWPLNTALYVTDFHGNDERFAYYFLKSIDFTRYNSGSAQASLNRNYIHPIPIEVPLLHEQRAIAQVLSTLDDKIELNRRINETLEAMARALFKSWFVDFNPVHERAEGHSPEGVDAETAALFPDCFEGSELGEIPKGWKVSMLGDVAINPRRGMSPEELEPDIPYIGLEHMPRRSIALGEWGTAQDVSSNKFRFHKGEILFGKLRPYFHKVGFAIVDGVCSTDILVVAPKESIWHGFVLAHLSSDKLIQYVTSATTGTRMPRTNWNDLAAYKIAIPSKEIANAFNRIISSFVQKIENNIWQSRTLAVLREALLPKLMSGEIRVKP